MAKVNFKAKYSDTIDAIADNVTEEVKVEEIVDPVKDAKVTCKQLNVRKDPKADADIVCVINDLTPIKVDTSFEDADFYKVELGTKIRGFCMKKFIEVK